MSNGNHRVIYTTNISEEYDDAYRGKYIEKDEELQYNNLNDYAKILVQESGIQLEFRIVSDKLYNERIFFVIHSYPEGTSTSKIFKLNPEIFGYKYSIIERITPKFDITSYRQYQMQVELKIRSTGWMYGMWINRKGNICLPERIEPRHIQKYDSLRINI